MQHGTIEQDAVRNASNPNDTGVQISLRHVGKQFAERKVLNDISLSIEAGQFVAIVGRSGCGKSTLLRLIAGLDTVSAGEILINECATQTLSHQIRIMFQEARLLPWKSVIGNVSIGLTSEYQHIAEGLLNEVGLLDRAKEWPSKLSGGQKQRVALARALAHRPKLLSLKTPAQLCQFLDNVI